MIGGGGGGGGEGEVGVVVLVGVGAGDLGFRGLSLFGFEVGFGLVLRGGRWGREKGGGEIGGKRRKKWEGEGRERGEGGERWRGRGVGACGSVVGSRRE